MPQTPTATPDPTNGAPAARDDSGVDGVSEAAGHADRGNESQELPADPPGATTEDHPPGATTEDHPSGAPTEDHPADSDPDAEPATGPVPEPVPEPVGRSAATSLLTWGTVALVLVIVVVLVILKVTGSTPTTTNSQTPPPQPAPAAVITAVTKIPHNVYDAIGITSPDEVVSIPTVLHGQPTLKIDGKPGLVFVGSEFCPYCAAERWSLVAALSRFGRFSLLPAAQSGSDEAFPGTPTFSFAGARYTSPYIGVRLVETYSNQKNGAGTAYSSLGPVSAQDRALLQRYDKATGATPGSLVPFVDVANQVVLAGGSFSPAVLEQLTMTQIASGLTDPKDPATQAIVASANYLSAAICGADGDRPAAVCSSRGVEAAATAPAQGS